MDREKLKQKIREKRNRRNTARPSNDPFNGETDIVKMMDRVNTILKSNPQMVQQISKCVSNVMNNQELMETLSGQLEKEITSQTLSSSSEEPNLDASQKDSTQ